MSWVSGLYKRLTGKLYTDTSMKIEEKKSEFLEAVEEKIATSTFTAPIVEEPEKVLSFITDKGEEVADPFAVRADVADAIDTSVDACLPSKEIDDLDGAKTFHADCTKMWIVEEGCIVRYTYNKRYKVIFEVDYVDDDRDYCHPVDGSVVLAHELFKDRDEKTRGLRLTPDLLRHFRVHGALCSRCRVIVTAKNKRVYDTDVYNEMIDNYEKVGV